MMNLWTPRRVEELKTLAGIGLRRNLIAKRMNLTPNQVNNGMARHGVKNNRKYRGGFPANCRYVNHNPKVKFTSDKNPNPAKPEGSISPDGSTIKINGKWIKHIKYVWEMHKGPIPKGKVVRKINKDAPVEIDNLVMVSQREHAKLNYNADKASETLKSKVVVKKESEYFNPREFSSFYKF